MGSACTLVCPIEAYSDVFATLENSSTSELIVQGRPDSWKQIEIRSPGSLIAFTSLVREKPGDEYSKLILSMHNFFRRIGTEANKNQRFVLECIANAKMLIGVVAEPAFSEDDWHFNCIWPIAEHLNAIVFSGEAMLNAKGERLLDKIGEADITI